MPIIRFKGSDSERELNTMWNSGVFANRKVTARQAYELSPTFQQEMTFQKFNYRYYNWRRRKLEDEEKERTGGVANPQGES